MSADSPNLLFLMTDHQRADSLDMVQAGIEVTPCLNRLARESVRFDRAYNICPLCVPARTALATGKFPTTTGVIHNRSRGQTTGDARPLQQYLAEGGYTVAHVGIQHVSIKPPLQERAPFALWITPKNHQTYLAEQGITDDVSPHQSPFTRGIRERCGDEYVEANFSNTKTAVWPWDAEHFLDNFLVREAARFLASGPTEPFALFVYLWAPHPPLRVPEPYASLFDPDALALPENVGVLPEGEPANRRMGVAAQISEDVPMEQWRRVWAAHLGLVNMADAALGHVLRALEESAAAERTITLFTVDHGDHLGQRLMYQKMEMYEPAIHVPLLIRATGLGHRRIDTPVSHLDIMPTLLDAVGIQDPGDLDGNSLLPHMRGDTPPERPVFGIYSGSRASGDTRRAVITRRYKYIFDPDDVAELYDLESDPLEMHNLAGDPTCHDILRELHRMCAAWSASHRDPIKYPAEPIVATRP